MAINAVNTPKSPINSVLQVENGDGTTTQALTTAGATAGRAIGKIVATSTDTSARTFQIYLYDGTTDHALFQVTVPAGAGTGTTTPYDVLTSSLFPSLPDDGVINLEAGYSLRVALTTGTVTSAKVVTFIVIDGADY